jgi:tetratricopeptide (TPR) repeat protein
LTLDSSSRAIADWLAQLGLERYAKAFEDNDLDDAELVATLSDEDLVSIGVGSLGHRRRILAAARGGELRAIASGGGPDTGARPRSTASPAPASVSPARGLVGAPLLVALEQRGLRIVDRLGHGGMGEVFRAKQIGVDRDVAIKVLRAREGEAERARFAREAKAIAALRHPNTVRLFDYLIADDGSACIVMEHVSGESLWARMTRERQLSFDRVVTIAIQVADALSEAHGKGIVHRDLKPGNVLLQDAEGYGEFAKVLDFGLARRMSDEESRLTHTGTVHGTPRYLSPEQILGTEVGPASDLYALGVTMYEALAGRAPFVADVDAALLFKHMKETAPPLPPEIERPAAFDGLMERLLAKPPSLRPASAAALRRELTAFVRGSIEVQGAGREPASGPIATERRALVVLDASFALRDEASAGDDEAHELARRGHALVDAIARRVGATVNARGAQGAQLVFGAPIARQHDARRAMETALELSAALQAIDPRLAVRIGVADGIAIAGPVRTGDASAGYLVSGGPVDRARALAAGTPIGTIAISETLAERAPQGLSIEREGTHAVLVGRDVRAQPSGSLPFVGRARELAAIRGWIEETRSSHRGRIVVISGEAGIGKSRLVERAIALAHSLGMRTARGAVFDVEVGADASPLHRITSELVDLPDEASGRQESSAERTRHNSVGPAPPGTPVDRGAALERRLGPTALRADQWPFLYHFLGIGLPGPMQRVYDAMDARTRMQGVLGTIAALAAHEAKAQPLLIVLEDVHWADGPTLDAIEALAAALSRSPILIVLTSRREDEARFRHVLLGHTSHRLELEPLGESEATALAAQLGVQEGDRQAQLVARAGGHPLLLTELSRRTEPESDTSLPTDVRGLVQARVDRLAEQDRAAIYAAAVLGPVMSPKTLADLIGAPTYVADALVEHRLLRRDEGMLGFVHALVRDAVYGALVDESRRALHEKAAVVTAHEPGVAAMHLDRAGSARAPLAYLEAARADLAVHRYPEARRHLTRGVAIATAAADRISLIEALGHLELTAFDPKAALDLFRMLTSIATTDGDVHRAELGIASALRATSARPAEALEALGRAEAAASRAGIVSSDVHSVRGGVLFATGQLEASREAHERALGIARERGEVEHEARALSGIADALYGQGRILDAMAQWEACVALARQHDLLGALATNLPMLAMMKVFANECVKARELAEQGLVLARELSRPRAEALGRGAASFAARVHGDPDEAEKHARAGIDLSRRLANAVFEQTSLYYLSEALVLRGQHDEAREVSDRTLALVRAGSGHFIGATAIAMAARLVTDRDAAQALLAEASALIGPTTLSFNRFWFRENAIEACLGTSDAVGARSHAEALLAEADLPPWPRAIGERGVLLARVLEGERGPAIEADLAALLERTAAASLGPASRSLEAALRKVSG